MHSVPKTRVATSDKQCSLPDAQISLWHLKIGSRLGELTALPAYLHISSYATLAMLSLINRSNACKWRTYPRRGLRTCVATGQQLEFDDQHF